jgi:hypothetical protein
MWRLTLAYRDTFARSLDLHLQTNLHRFGAGAVTKCDRVMYFMCNKAKIITPDIKQ